MFEPSSLFTTYLGQTTQIASDAFHDINLAVY